MKDAYYFSHDANARNDPKILALRSVYGYEGYGWYWALIEMLREQRDYKLKLDGKYDCNAYAMQMQCTADAVKKFINDCIFEFELFDSDGVYFWSNSLIRRMGLREEKSDKARKAALARWEKDKEPHSERNADAMQTHSERNAIKGKESKVKESSKKHYAEFVSLTEDEYLKLINEHGKDFVDRCIEVLDNYKGSTGKRYKSDYRTILNWVIKRVTEEKGGTNHGGGQATGKPGKRSGTDRNNGSQGQTNKFDSIDYSKFMYKPKPGEMPDM
jgi:hypothetical protein